MNSRVYQTEALVLRRISFGETDRVLVLFTRDRGKLSAIAKGARRPLSRLGGGCEPFIQSTVQLAVGQNLDVLTQCQVERSFAGLRRDLVKVGYASYLLEVVEASVAERQPQPELWDLLVASLALLEEATTPDVLVRAFEVGAMSLLGYEPELSACLRCHQELDEPGGGFHPLRGGVVCGRCLGRSAGALPVAAGTVALLRAMLHRPLQQFQNLPAPVEQRRELGRCLIPYLRHRLEAPLRSLEFLETVTADAT
jgi:DNA repair protein RecO (recombination protein O)